MGHRPPARPGALAMLGQILFGVFLIGSFFGRCALSSRNGRAYFVSLGGPGFSATVMFICAWCRICIGWSRPGAAAVSPMRLGTAIPGKALRPFGNRSTSFHTWYLQ